MSQFLCLYLRQIRVDIAPKSTGVARMYKRQHSYEFARAVVARNIEVGKLPSGDERAQKSLETVQYVFGHEDQQPAQQ